MIGRPSCAIGWTPHKRSLPRHGKAKIGRARKANDAQDEAAALRQAADAQRALGGWARLRRAWGEVAGQGRAAGEGTLSGSRRPISGGECLLHPGTLAADILSAMARNASP